MLSHRGIANYVVCELATTPNGVHSPRRNLHLHDSKYCQLVLPPTSRYLKKQNCSVILPPMDNGLKEKSVMISRRHLLSLGTSGAAIIGFAWIYHDLFVERGTHMTTSNEQFAIQKTEEEWLAELTPEQFRVLRKHGTERAGTSPLDKFYEPGTYSCAGCGQALFSSDTKYNSGTGWPSFYKPIDGAIATSVDKTLFMTRVEVHCSRCGGHLGHVFKDGPAPTGLRYCMNGIAMNFTPTEG